MSIIEYDSLPQEFCCPITYDIMNDPVICEDGYTYERSAILLIQDLLSPMTREPININKLIPNRALKDSIEKYKSESQNKFIKRNITDIILFEDIYKFEFEVSNDNIYIRLIDMQSEVLYDANLNISNLNIKPINKFFLIIIRSLNKEPNYNVTMNKRIDMIILNFSYTELQEKVCLFKNNSNNVKEYILTSKIRKLENQITELSFKTTIENPIMVKNIEIDKETNMNKTITSQLVDHDRESIKYYEREQQRLQKIINDTFFN